MGAMSDLHIAMQELSTEERMSLLTVQHLTPLSRGGLVPATRAGLPGTIRSLLAARLIEISEHHDNEHVGLTADGRVIARYLATVMGAK